MLGQLFLPQRLRRRAAHTRPLRASGNAWKKVLRIYSKEPGSKISVCIMVHDERWRPYELAKLLDHSHIKMTERYANLAKHHIARTSNTAREMWKLLEPIGAKEAVG